ncbi:hypothetical protein Tco_1321549 [Tanacetum coccineum]
MIWIEGCGKYVVCEPVIKEAVINKVALLLLPAACHCQTEICLKREGLDVDSIHLNKELYYRIELTSFKIFMGIILALAIAFPSAEHRYHLRHIHDNMKRQWSGRAFKDHLWRCATSTTV